MRSASPGRLDLETERLETPGGVVEVIRAQGEVDLSNASALESALEAAAADKGGVLIDLTGVPFMDSSGLRVMLVAARDLGARLAVVVSPGSPVLRLFEVAEVADRIPSFGVESEALDAIANSGPSGD